jgi:hypothetical protein
MSPDDAAAAPDSSLSASQLRQRYLKGGSLPDSALSASQLRARHGLASNARGFSTSEWAPAGARGGAAGGACCGLSAAAAAALLGLALILAAAAAAALFRR